MRVLKAAAVGLGLALLATSVPAWAKGPPPPKVDMDKREKRPKMDASDEVETMLGAIVPPEGFEPRSLTSGRVKLDSGDGVVVVIDELASEDVEDGAYTAESVKMLLAKEFEPRIVKDPEEPDDEYVVLRFRGFGATEDGTVAFRLDLVDGVSGAGLVMVYGPNSRRAEIEEIGDEVLDLLPL